MSILLKNAMILDSKSSFNQSRKDILIKEGIIVEIADKISPKAGYEIIEKEGLCVSQGWFDTSVSFGEPGFEERETIKNGLETAAKSGFTAVALNPNTEPILDTKADIEFVIHKSKNSACKLYPIGALTQKSAGIEMAELFDMQQSGAIAFGDYQKPIENDNLMKIALQYAQIFDGLVLSFPKNNSIAGEGVANEGIHSTKLGLKGIPALAEHIQIARDLYLLEYSGGKLHIPTISTEKSVALIKEAKAKGLQVTCSVAAHHLTLSDSELSEFDSNYKLNPPLRTQEDIFALRNGIKEGIIDCITSDHNPIDIENKKLEFSQALDGTVGLESLFCSLNGVLNTADLVDCLTHKPKTIFGIDQYPIEEGQKANLTLFNSDFESTFAESHILSKSKNSAFLGKAIKGKIYGVFSNHQLVLND